MKRPLAFLLFLALALGPWGCSSENSGLSSSGKERVQAPVPSDNSWPSGNEESFSHRQDFSEPAPPMQPPPKIDPKDLKELVRGNNEFALDLYARLAQTTEGNMVFSPFSISTALAMTYAGARGQTAKEMAKVLHFTLPPERLHPAFANLLWELGGDGKPRPFQLHTANALWGQKGYPWLEEFLGLNKTYYGAGLKEVDFFGSLEEAILAINCWVKTQTRGKIPQLLHKRDLNEKTRLVLTNAVWFKAAWALPFSKENTREVDFFISAQKKVTVPMMLQDDFFNYHESEDCQILELQYKDQTMSLLVLLPKKVDGLALVVKNLTQKKLNHLIGQLKGGQGRVFLPRFTPKMRCRLRKDLTQLGMFLPFSEKADFSGILPWEKLGIDDVVHEALIEVDEKGTEAAAATAVVGHRIVSERVLPQPVIFRADHPFLFLIRDNSTESILFLGRVMAPTPL